MLNCLHFISCCFWLWIHQQSTKIILQCIFTSLFLKQELYLFSSCVTTVIPCARVARVNCFLGIWVKDRCCIVHVKERQHFLANFLRTKPLWSIRNKIFKKPEEVKRVFCRVLVHLVRRQRSAWNFSLPIWEFNPSRWVCSKKGSKQNALEKVLLLLLETWSKVLYVVLVDSLCFLGSHTTFRCYAWITFSFSFDSGR